jgi:acetyl esterase/lipase
LTVVGGLSALLTLVTCYYTLEFVAFDGLGRLGVVALLLAPQLLLVSAVAAGLGMVAYRRGASFAAGTFGVVLLLTFIMGVFPTIAVWRRAQEYQVPVSLGSALMPSVSDGAPQLDKTVTYGVATDGSRLVLDVWRAPGAPGRARRPAIVKVHGGGWNHGARSEGAHWNRWLNQQGYDVFDVDYRMPPPARWRDEVGDVKCALGWVAAHASRYDLDTTRISLMGYSAGGNLALLAAYSMGDPQLPPSCPTRGVDVRSVINLYGPADMATLYRTSGSPTYLAPLMRAYIGGPPSTLAARYHLLSPINHVDEHTPPTITVQGEADRVVPPGQAAILDTALSQAGIPHETYYLPWADHGFDVVVGSIASQIARAKVAEFLAFHSTR